MLSSRSDYRYVNVADINIRGEIAPSAPVAADVRYPLRAEDLAFIEEGRRERFDEERPDGSVTIPKRIRQAVLQALKANVDFVDREWKRDLGFDYGRVFVPKNYTVSSDLHEMTTEKFDPSVEIRGTFDLKLTDYDVSAAKLDLDYLRRAHHDLNELTTMVESDVCLDSGARAARFSGTANGLSFSNRLYSAIIANCPAHPYYSFDAYSTDPSGEPIVRTVDECSCYRVGVERLFSRLDGSVIAQLWGVRFGLVYRAGGITRQGGGLTSYWMVWVPGNLVDETLNSYVVPASYMSSSFVRQILLDTLGNFSAYYTGSAELLQIIPIIRPRFRGESSSIGWVY